MEYSEVKVVNLITSLTKLMQNMEVDARKAERKTLKHIQIFMVTLPQSRKQ